MKYNGPVIIKIFIIVEQNYFSWKTYSPKHAQTGWQPLSMGSYFFYKLSI